MGDERSGHMAVLRELLETQLLGVLGTHRAGAPYTSLVGFAATPDLRHLLFATGRATRKHANLVADARASMLIDNRSNRVADFTAAAAATANGVVEEVADADRPAFEALFLAQAPAPRELRSLAQLRTAPTPRLRLRGGDRLPAGRRVARRRMTWLLALDEITDADAPRVGGKATALAALHRAGVRVPPTVCLTADAYELFVEHAHLRGSIQQELGRKRFADMRWEEVWDAALRIRNRFLRAPFPSELEAALAEYLCRDGEAAPRVIRSSAPGEDGQGTSFAGVHDSFVDVRGLPALVDAVRGVWASLFNDRALLYRRELDLSVDGSTMAVLLQHLVEGASSGVAFGVHPTDPEHMAVEAVYGLNQGLVDGTIEPDRWTLDSIDGRVLAHVPPAARRRLVARGDGLVVEDVPSPEAARAPLDAAGLATVHRAVREAGALFGSPQDVEWTKAGVRSSSCSRAPSRRRRAARGTRARGT